MGNLILEHQRRVILGSKLKQWIIPITGQSSGTPTAGTMVFSATEDMTLTATGDVSISVVRANDSIYRLHTVTINCPNNGSGTIRVPDRSKIVAMGNHNGAFLPNVNFYTGTNTTSPILAWNLNDLGANVQKIRQLSTYTAILPTTGNQALPTALTSLLIRGNNINWTYTGALPVGITGDLNLTGENINWTHTGNLPMNVSASLVLNGNNIKWTYTGALPVGINYMYLVGANINWTHTGDLPLGIAGDLGLIGANINWTGLSILGSGNFVSFALNNFRIAKMSSPDMVTLLTSLTNRVGGLPATITINDYADFASPPQSVIDAVAALKLAKPNVTTVNLGA